MKYLDNLEEELCRNLITFANLISPNEDFGCLDSGFMNIENMRRLYSELQKNIVVERKEMV